jgi:hypothetical protein
MRVRELLAANAFCLLAMTCAGCARVEQPVGEYNSHDRPAHPSEELPDPMDMRPSREGGVSTSPLADAAISDASTDPPETSLDSGQVDNSPSTWLPPPILLDAGPSSSGGGTMCKVLPVVAERRRLDMYLMVDSNITVAASGVWEVMTDGITGFVQDRRSSGTGVGIRYFGNTCVPRDYAQPSVEIDLLPANASDIVLSTRTRRWSASPMLPALDGAIMHQKERGRLHPDWKQVVVLVSDGFTGDFQCLYTTQGLAESARDALVGNPSVETHVIGVGVTTNVIQPLDQLIERLGAFNAIADAGGSVEAVTTDITGNATQFSEALQRVRRKAAPCEYRTPTGLTTTGYGLARYPLATELPRVSNERSCADQQGWYYAVESLPTPVTLCPATCDWLAGSDLNKIGMFTGCDDSQTAPP